MTGHIGTRTIRLVGGDGRKLVTLLGLWCLAAASYWLTLPQLAQDSTARYVPLAAASYLHADYVGSPLALPENWTADEVARFTVAVDGRSERGAIIVWRGDRRPSDQEASRLAEVGWLLGDATYLVANPVLAKYALAKIAATETLTTAPAIRRSLAWPTLRFALQGYVQPAATALSANSPLAALKSVAPFVIGWNESATGFSGVLRPVFSDSVTASSPTAALAAPLPDISSSLTTVWGKSLINPIPLLFSEAERLHTIRGRPETERLATTRAALIELIGYPDWLVVRAGAKDSAIDIAAAYSRVSLVDYKEVATRYLGELLPQTQFVKLSDGSTVREIIAKDGGFSFNDKAEGYSSLISKEGVLPQFIAQSGDILILSTNYSLLNELIVGGRPNKAFAVCSGVKAQSGLKMDRLVADKLLGTLGLRSYLRLASSVSLTVVPSADSKTLITCGQTVPTVDK